MKNMKSRDFFEEGAIRSVLLVDDHRLYADLVEMYFRSKGVRVDVFDDYHQLFEAAEKGEVKFEEYDVICLDLIVSGYQGPRTLEAVAALAEPTPVVVVSAATDRNLIFPALNAGVSGVFSKGEGLEKFLKVLNFVKQGENYYPKQFLTDNYAISSIDITPQERRALKEISRGHSNKEIAFIMECTEANIKSIVRNLCLKLGVENRTKLAIKAIMFPQLVFQDLEGSS
jgi:two-component system nitrate/nitrite response regulator NarP